MKSLLVQSAKNFTMIQLTFFVTCLMFSSNFPDSTAAGLLTFSYAIIWLMSFLPTLALSFIFAALSTK